MDRRIVFGSTALVATLLVFAVLEQDRPWKRLQTVYQADEVLRLQGLIEEERRRIAEQVPTLEEDLLASREAHEADQSVIRPLEKELASARRAEQWATADLRLLDEQRQRLVNPRTASAASADVLAVLEEEERAARARLEEARETMRLPEERLQDLTADLRDLEERWARETEKLATFEERLAALEDWGLWRHLPAFNPHLQVHEIDPGLEEQRLDRCVTCHLGIADGVGTESREPPLTSHPRLDLYVSEDSPHPYRSFGCTVCHGGQGRATSFSSAGHWPTTTATEQQWRSDWDFDPQRVPENPILPPSLVEASCTRCHSEDVDTDGASLELGRRLLLKTGCAGCHEVGDPAARPMAKPGPPLSLIAHKTTPGWVFRWIEAPRRFRETTWMPHLLDDVPDDERTALIRAMVFYLWEKALPSPVSLDPVNGQENGRTGNAARGETLFQSLGCAGCHLLDPLATRASVFPDLDRLHGPNLAFSGDKLDPTWLTAWLSDPHAWRIDTPMPNLRLSASENNDLVAYLMASRRSQAVDPDLPSADSQVRDRLVKAFLEEKQTLVETENRLARMDNTAKDLYLGERALAAYGCAGCHEIPGLEDVAPTSVGGSLVDVGRQPRQFLGEEGLATVAHQRLGQKPGVPDYGLSQAEADTIRVSLLSWDGSSVAPERRADRAERSQTLSEGRRLLWHFGCLSCHRLDENGGLAPGAAEEPPDLTSGGRRLKASWLFAYLNDPAAYERRTWLKIRMPTYRMKTTEANALVRFFAAHDQEPLFVAAPPDPQKVDVAVGRAVVEVLQCDRCHADSSEADKLATPALAPSYRDAAERLRPDWVVQWILDPASLIPGTRMPASFPMRDGYQDSGYLVDSLAAPMFAIQSQRLLPYFESEAEMRDYMNDAHRVASAVRDYLWTQ